MRKKNWSQMFCRVVPHLFMLISWRLPKTYFIDAARDIKNAFGLFNDDEAAIVRAFKKALTKQEINLISRSYSALYKTDLFFDISNRLNIKELEPIYSYILKLPETIPGKK